MERIDKIRNATNELLEATTSDQKVSALCETILFLCQEIDYKDRLLSENRKLFIKAMGDIG